MKIGHLILLALLPVSVVLLSWLYGYQANVTDLVMFVLGCIFTISGVVVYVLSKKEGGE